MSPRMHDAAPLILTLAFDEPTVTGFTAALAEHRVEGSAR